MDRFVLVTASWLTALCGAWLLVSAAGDLFAGRRAESWPAVQGHLAEVATREVHIGRFLPLGIRIEIVYEYPVDEVQYRGSRVTFDGILPRGFDPRGLPVGSPVTVHYNPANPGEAVLFPGVTTGLMIYGGIAGFFLLISLVLRRLAAALRPVTPERGRRGRRPRQGRK